MKSNAAGQFLGYVLQIPRALFHLLQCSPNESICVEMLGDVAKKLSDGTIVTEEDKSSITSNPLTNKSENLWKTFSNWIDAVKSGDLANTAKFIIYTNKVGRKGIINEFNDAKNSSSAQEAFTKAKAQLKNLSTKHVAYDFYQNCVSNENILIEIISKFELCISDDKTGLKDLKIELQKKLIPDTQINFFLELMSGWILSELLNKIANKDFPTITFESFRQRYEDIVNRARKRELIDFTLNTPLEEDLVKEAAKLRPTYVRQLDKLGVDEDEILEAVADFMRAKVNRDKWIELEIVSEVIAEDFEDRLIKFWNNQKTKGEIIYKNNSPEERGILLLTECKIRSEPINDMIPPAPTISGTYHALADLATLGWHPDWEKDFKK